MSLSQDSKTTGEPNIHELLTSIEDLLDSDSRTRTSFHTPASSFEFCHAYNSKSSIGVPRKHSTSRWIPSVIPSSSTDSRRRESAVVPLRQIDFTVDGLIGSKMSPGTGLQSSDSTVPGVNSFASDSVRSMEVATVREQRTHMSQPPFACVLLKSCTANVYSWNTLKSQPSLEQNRVSPEKGPTNSISLTGDSELEELLRLRSSLVNEDLSDPDRVPGLKGIFQGYRVKAGGFCGTKPGTTSTYLRQLRRKAATSGGAVLDREKNRMRNRIDCLGKRIDNGSTQEYELSDSELWMRVLCFPLERPNVP